jgi:hypothetical protein
VSKYHHCVPFVAIVLFLVPAVAPADQGKVTTPLEQFGFNLGDDYCLTNYTQLVAYWQKLAAESDRIKLETIGQTEEGRDIIMAIVTSPKNHRHLARHKENSKRLALADGLDETEAKKIAAEGKAVVWIDGGLHANETLGAQQLMETVYQLVSQDDAETRRFLNDVIVLFCCVNPDGMELVSNWYMREPDPKKRSLGGLPRLYQKYIGHDNNRDFYMVTQKETEAICRVFYQDWFPQIVYNHHQTGPVGTVLFAPPFRDPFNYNFDPLVPVGIDLVGAAMHSRFIAEGKPGATMRKGANYSTWFNGGLRTGVYFHNMIGLLTETIGSPTPMEIPFNLQRQLASADLPFPITPQSWHFRQSVDYSVTANRAVIDVASRHREQFLYNIYRMGRNSIERGNRDHWTIKPQRIAAAKSAMDRTSSISNSGRPGRNERVESRPGSDGGEFSAQDAPPKSGDESTSGTSLPARRGSNVFKDVLRDPEFRDPRGYVIPADQSDFLTCTKFVNTLIKNGIVVHRATSIFEVGGKTYPAGSYVVKCAQAFRPHILDMFEPQDHPDDFQYPGGPPIPPYDSSGWTLALQMGVAFDRIMDGFDGPFERIEGQAKPPSGAVPKANGAAGFLVSHRVNDSFIAMNRLLRDGEQVSWLKSAVEIGGKHYPPGTLFIPQGSATAPKLQKIADEVGLTFEPIAERPACESIKLKQPRIALWDTYGGSMPSGWVRWILERFDFDFHVVYAPELDRGDLASRYDVLILPGTAIPDAARGSGGGNRESRLPDAASIPAEYHERLGRISSDKTMPQLKKFVEEGGTIIAIGASVGPLARQLELPVANALVERKDDGTEQALGSTKFYVPGSILRMRVDNDNPHAFGLGDHADVYFQNNTVLRLKPEANREGVKAIAWFDEEKPLRSGWAWGQHYLRDGVAAVEATLGKGTVVLFGPEITFRAQPHGTFKFLFNSIYYGPSK